MFYLRITAVALLCAILSLQAKDKPKVCIANFTELNNKVPDLNKTAVSKLEDLLVSFGCVDIVNIASIQDLLKNNAITDSISEDLIIKNKGIIKGVDYIVFGEVSNGNVTRTFSSRSIDDGKSSENYWNWRCTPSVKLQVIDMKTGKIVYSQKQTSLEVSEEAVQEEKSLAGVINMIKAIKDTTNKKEDEIDPNQVSPQMAVEGTAGAVHMHDDELYNIFRPSGVIISIEDTDKKGKKKTLTLDIGQNFGIKNGNKFEIVKKSPDITHPTTGEIIAGKETILMTLRVESTDAEISTAIAKAKEMNDIAVGSLVRMAKR